VKIAPALPNPQPSTAPRGRSAVVAVQAANATRQAPDQLDRHPPLNQAADPSEAEQVPARGEILATRQVAPPARVAHALASYAQVASDREDHSLRALLGFDAYA